MQSYETQSRRATPKSVAAYGPGQTFTPADQAWRDQNGCGEWLPETTANDLGDDALALWQLRYAIEGNALAAVAADPSALWPTFTGTGTTLQHFDCPLHRGVYVILRECHTRGRFTCARLSAILGDRLGYFRDDVVDLFEKFPPSEGNVTYRARRLTVVAAALGTAHGHLAKARSIVSAGLSAMTLEGVAA